MTTTNPYATAARLYRDELGAAMEMNDPSLSASGLAERQRAAIESARARLLGSLPTLPQGGMSREDVLTSLRPNTADEVARMRHEQEHVQRLLDNGRPLSEIIRDAPTADRALAIADLVETLPNVLSSASGDQIVAEVRGLVFERLADLDVEAAKNARAAEQQGAPATAWHRALTEMAAGSNASIGAWQDVYRADPEGYEAVRGGFDGRVDDRVRRFDQAAVSHTA